MTESTETTPTPDPAAEKAPAKKTAAKKTAAKKTAAAEPAAATKPEPRNLYLPALPDGFEYTSITAVGKNGETLTMAASAGPDAQAGEFTLSFDGAGLKRDSKYPDAKGAVAAAAKAARAMHDVAKREAELAAVREQALDF